MWHLVFFKYKLKAARQKLQQVIGDYYTCGAKLEDLNLGEEFKDVDVKDHSFMWGPNRETELFN